MTHDEQQGTSPGHSGEAAANEHEGTTMTIDQIDRDDADEFDDDSWLEQLCDAQEERILQAIELERDYQRQRRELDERLERDMFAWEKRTRGA